MLVKGSHCSRHPIFIFHGLGELNRTPFDLQEVQMKISNACPLIYKTDATPWPFLYLRHGQ